jgi:hypothetical protein
VTTTTSVIGMENTVETKDISLVAYLFATGKVTLAGKRKLSSGEIYFAFTPKKLSEELITQYWNLQAPSIQPKHLFSAMRDVKDMIFGT